MAQEQLLTVRQAASWAQVSAWSLYTSIRRGTLRCYRIGPSRWGIRLSHEHLRDWMQGTTNNHTDFEHGGPQ